MCFHHAKTETQSNIESIEQIPERLLPKGHPARIDLLARAARGDDAYAYTPMQLATRKDEKRWNVWVAGKRWELERWRDYHGTVE